VQELKKYRDEHGEKCKVPCRAVRCIYSDAPSCIQSVGFSRRQTSDFYSVRAAYVLLFFLIPERFALLYCQATRIPHKGQKAKGHLGTGLPIDAATSRRGSSTRTRLLH